MKVSLIVASGAHQGKVIPLTGPQFLIGRDQQCHLRPASQAISKRHCVVFVRDGKVYVKDFGSTNGTTVNDQLIRGEEVVVEHGASLKVGPLDFTIGIELRAPTPDGTPLPNPEAAAALAAVKAVSGAPKGPARDATPSPARAGKPGSKESPALTGSKETGAMARSSAETPPAAVNAATEDDHDRIAAMLLGMEDDSPPVPDGSTVIESPAVDAQGQPLPQSAKPDDKNKKQSMSREDMSNAASEALRRMMRRPK